MTLEEMKAYLLEHGAEAETHYSLGGLAGGEIVGIEMIDGDWYTYYSERGSKNSYQKWESEEEAVAYVMRDVELTARAWKQWKD